MSSSAAAASNRGQQHDRRAGGESRVHLHGLPEGVEQRQREQVHIVRVQAEQPAG